MTTETGRTYDIDGVSKFMKFRWHSPEELRLEIRPEHITAPGSCPGS